MGCCVNHSLVNSWKQSVHSNVIALKYSGTMILIFLSDHLIRSSIRCAHLRFDHDISMENSARQLS